MKRLIPLLLLAFALPLIAQQSVPPAPTNLKAELIPSFVPAVVGLTWDAQAGPWGFKVYRSAGDTLNFKPVAIVNSRVYYDNLHEPKGLYFWTVTAIAISPDSHLLESKHSNIVKMGFGPPPATKGVIAGNVKDDTTGKPIAGIAIRFFRNGLSITLWPPPTAYTDNRGHYAAVLDTGTYFVRADPPPYMPPGPPAYRSEWFDNVQEMTQATPVKVASADTAHADFGLSPIKPPVKPKGIIAGTVIDDSTTKPIRAVMIRFYGRNATTAAVNALTAVTDSNGFYKAELDTGTYLIRAETPPTTNAWSKSYRAEWFDNVTEVAQATPVKVTTGATFTANFGLMPLQPPIPSFIEGTVTDTLGPPLRRAEVVIMRPLTQMLSSPATGVNETDGESMEIAGVGYCRGVVWRGTTDSLGHYKAQVPGPAKYIAMAAKWGYIPEYYKDRRNPLQADIIAVNGTVSNINFTLTQNPNLQNSISGSVRDSLGNGVPSRIALIPAVLTPSFFRHLRFGHTDSTGAYTIGEVVSGNYLVLAVPFRGYAPAFYKAGAYGVLNWQKADAVTISGNVTGIDIGVVPIRFAGIAHLGGRVTTSTGSGLEGVRIVATSPAGDVVGVAISETDGGYALEGLPAGTLTLHYDREGYQETARGQTIQTTTYSLDNVNQSLQAVVTDVGAVDGAPDNFALNQNYPNPFNPSTTIGYVVPGSGLKDVKLAVYDVLGRQVALLMNGRQTPGAYSVRFDASSISSGTYFYRLEVSGAVQTRKMTLVR